jgi:hypothetical protein
VEASAVPLALKVRSESLVVVLNCGGREGEVAGIESTGDIVWFRPLPAVGKPPPVWFLEDESSDDDSGSVQGIVGREMMTIGATGPGVAVMSRGCCWGQCDNKGTGTQLLLMQSRVTG